MGYRSVRTDIDYQDSDDQWLGNEWSSTTGERGYQIEQAVTVSAEPLFLDLNGNGTLNETGLSLDLIKFYESSIDPYGNGEERIMYRTSNGENLGGYVINSGYKVVIDGNWAPTGQLVSSTGEELNIFTDLLQFGNWAHDSEVISEWATENSETSTGDTLVGKWVPLKSTDFRSRGIHHRIFDGWTNPYRCQDYRICLYL